MDADFILISSVISLVLATSSFALACAILSVLQKYFPHNLYDTNKHMNQQFYLPKIWPPVPVTDKREKTAA